MPRVPTLGNAPRVSPAGLPGVRQSSNASPALMGGIAADQVQQAGRGVMALGETLNKQAIDAQNEANQIRVNDALNKAVEAKLRRTYDPKEGYSNLRGNDALTRPDGKALDEEFLEKYSADLSGIEEGLGNDAQKQAFREQAGRMAVQFRAGILQHRDGEYKKYSDSVNKGTVDVAQNQMGLEWGNPEAVNQSRSAIRAAVAEMGKRNGWAGTAIEAATVAELSKGHAAVLAASTDAGKLDYAREYFKQHKDELTPEARLTVQKIIDAGDFEARAQDGADTLWSKHKGDVGAALAEAREKHSGKDEDAIVQRIKAYDAERVALRERAQKDAADQAWKIYATRGRLGNIPPSVIAAMDGKDLEALRRTAKADAGGTAAKTDSSVYYALSIAAAQDPNFANQDLRLFFDKLSPGDRKHFIDLQTKVGKSEDGAHVVGIGEQKTAMTRALGLKDEQAGMFHQVADKALFAAQQEKGKKLNQDEVQKVLDKLVLQGEVASGSWYSADSDKRLFEAIAAGEEGKFQAEFSDADRNKATAALQRRGITNPTKQQVEATLRAAYGTK